MGLMPEQMRGAPAGPMPGQGQEQPAPPVPGEQVASDEGTTPSPEEQAQYSKFEQNYLAVIYNENGEVSPEVLDMLQNPAPTPPEMQGEMASPPVTALATAAVTITQELDDSARKAGKPLTDDVLFHGGVAVVEELAEVAEAAKIHDYTEDELSGAVSLAVSMYRDKAIADGRTDEQQLAQQFDEIQRANQEGRDAEYFGVSGAEAAQPMEEENGGR